MRLLRCGAMTLVVLVQTACSLSASPADGLSFKAPAGWQSSPGIMGLMQFWHPPNDERQVLMLFKSPKPLKPSDVFSDQRLGDTLKDVSIERRSEIRICGAQPAVYVQARGASKRSGDERVEMVLTTSGGSSYMAMYAYPVAGLPNPTAVSALRELCAKP